MATHFPLAPIRVPLKRSWTQKPPLRARIDWRHPLSRGLEVCWLCNEGQGEWLYDCTGHGHDAVFGGDATGRTNMVWDVAGGRGSPYGPAPRFANTVLAGTANITLPIILGNQWTVEFWYAPGTVGGPTTGTLLMGENGEAWIFANNTGNTVIGYVAPGISAINGPAALAPELWYHVALTMQPHPTTPDQGLLQFWFNGLHKAADVTSATAWESAIFRRIGNGVSVTPLKGRLALGRVWTRALDQVEIVHLRANPFAMIAHPLMLVASQAPPLPPVVMSWRVPVALVANRVLRIEPVRVRWVHGVPVFTGQLPGGIRPAVMRWAPQLFHRSLAIVPAPVIWRTSRMTLPVNLILRDCGPDYDFALQQTTIRGDWLIQAPAIGLYVSMNYNFGGTWEHRIVDISDIEVSVPPGGGITTAANVTVSIAETHSGQSILELWDAASAVGAVEVTIDFLLEGADHVLRIFTGHIDSITVKDAVSQLLLVDDSIRKNLLLPTTLVKVEEYPQADTAALTKAIPLLYGQGSLIGGAPLLLVDVPSNTYLVAAHPMLLGGLIAVYDQPTQTFLTLETVLFIPNNGTATITLGTVNTTQVDVVDYAPFVINPAYAVDGNSTTVTRIGTDYAGPGYDSAIQVGDGWGFESLAFRGRGYPYTTTVMFTITNHRRVPGSDPTTTGTFYLRGLDADFPSTIETRKFFVSPAFNHTTSAQTNVFVISNLNIGINERLGVVLLTRCAGTIGSTSQAYEVGEISLTPLVAFSASTSGNPTAIALPLNIQELRFNRQRPALSLYSSVNVSQGAYAIDGNSLTLAKIYTSSLDSNLDGIGELTIITNVTSAQRANNTVAIDLVNHRRALTSDPTVTGTFSIQTHNTNTGVLLRDNLFVTQAFRHTLNPQTTSFVATAINLGATAQLAVRLVARKEGGIGNANQYYEVGDIGIETFYQPRGDSGEIFLYGAGYEGRRDTTGTVITYLDLLMGRLYQTPDQVIASFYAEEIGSPIHATTFTAAYNFFSVNSLRFDGGIGAGWAIEQAPAREILDGLARQSTSILFPTFADTWGIRPFTADLAVHQAFGAHNILTEMGAESQPSQEWMSTLMLTLGNLQDVHNHFEVRYRYNTGSRKYDKIWKVTKDGSNLPDTDTDKAAIETTCYTSWLRYGDLDPLIVEANWIADDTTAAYLLRHLAFYFSQQRITAQFDTTFQAMCLQVGDFITITDPLLPTGDNGGTFEVHSLRYMPLKGRIQLRASRVAQIPDVILPDPPVGAVGCARFADSPGLLACWDFEEASGTRTDHIQGLTLAEGNGLVVGVAGKVGSAVQLLRAGSQSLSNTEVLPGALTGAFTLACWVRLLSLPSATWVIAGNMEGLFQGTLEFALTVGLGGGVQMTCGVEGVGGIGAPDGVLPYTGTAADWSLLRTWRTCSAAFGGTLYMQLNNGTVTTQPFTGALPRAYGRFMLGAGRESGSTTYYANVEIDQFMLWNRVLGQAELDAIWNGGLG